MSEKGGLLLKGKEVYAGDFYTPAVTFEEYKELGIGNVVWGLEITEKTLCGCPVNAIFVGKDGNVIVDAINYDEEQEIMFEPDDLGKTVFLSREEAERTAKKCGRR